MNIILKETFWITYFLVSIRLSAAILGTQLIAYTYIPTRIKVMLVLVLSYFVASLAPQMNMTTDISFVSLSAALELIIGLAFAFGILTAFAAINFGYRLVEFQMGLSMSGIVDPAMQGTRSVVGFAVELLAIMMFWMANLHHTLIKVMLKSFEIFPINGSLSGLNLFTVSQRTAIVFSLGLAVVAPVLITILLLDIGLAYFGRTMPQVNIFFVAMPLKILVGMFVLITSMDYVIGLLENNNVGIFNYFGQLKN